MKPYWKKPVHMICATAISFIALFVATESATAKEVEPIVSYQPFTIEHQMDLVKEDQLLLAVKNEKERMELEKKLEQERLEKERLERERQEKERLERERQEKERLERERIAKEKAKKEAERKQAQQAQQAQKNTQSNPSSNSSNQAPQKALKTLNVRATAYTAYCDGCSGITKTGINLRANPHLKVIAVDPSVIPLGSTVYVPGYGTAIAGDIGGAIKGNRIDVFFPSKNTAYQWGVKNITIQIISYP